MAGHQNVDLELCDANSGLFGFGVHATGKHCPHLVYLLVVVVGPLKVSLKNCHGSQPWKVWTTLHTISLSLDTWWLCLWMQQSHLSNWFPFISTDLQTIFLVSSWPWIMCLFLHSIQMGIVRSLSNVRSAILRSLPQEQGLRILSKKFLLWKHCVHVSITVQLVRSGSLPLSN